MTEDVREKASLNHEAVVGLNFIRDSAIFVFRRHYRQGLRSHIMEVLDPWGYITRAHLTQLLIRMNKGSGDRSETSAERWIQRVRIGVGTVLRSRNPLLSRKVISLG
jgi:hypothetical protein